MIARVRLNEYRESYTRKLRRWWVAERLNTDSKEWDFIAAEDSALLAKQKIEDWCASRRLPVPEHIDVWR